MRVDRNVYFNPAHRGSHLFNFLSCWITSTLYSVNKKSLVGHSVLNIKHWSEKSQAKWPPNPIFPEIVWTSCRRHYRLLKQFTLKLKNADKTNQTNKKLSLSDMCDYMSLWIFSPSKYKQPRPVLISTVCVHKHLISSRNNLLSLRYTAL